MNTTLNPPAAGCHPVWEQEIYGQGRQLNLYPYHAVVSFVFRNFGKVPDRSRIRLLELGCGAGNNLWFAAREGFRVAGIDGSASAITYAKERFLRDGLVGDLQVGCFSDLPWPDETFDAVIDRGALTCAHRQVIEGALDGAYRVLKPSGRLLSVIYSDAHPGRAFGCDTGDNTYREFTDGYFVGLGTAHFAPVEEIQTLFGSRFRMLSQVHTLETDHLTGQDIDAFWRIECEKPA